MNEIEGSPEEKLDLTEDNLKRFSDGMTRLADLNISPCDPDKDTDLINLETPRVTVFSPESSLTSFTTLAESRTRKAHQEMESLSENQTTAESNHETIRESDMTRAKSEDNNTTQSQKSQEEAQMPSKPQILPRKSKTASTSTTMENPTKMENPTSEMSNPDSKPKPKPRQPRKSENEQVTSRYVIAQ